MIQLNGKLSRNFEGELCISGIPAAEFLERNLERILESEYEDVELNVYMTDPSQTVNCEESMDGVALADVKVRVYAIEERSDAVAMLNNMIEYADIYKSVPIVQYYDQLGYPSSYKDYSYGWSLNSIKKAKVVKYRDHGWVINFPPVEVI